MSPKTSMPLTWSDIFKVILAIILPPIAVAWERGLSIDLLINILLTILGYIPGTNPALFTDRFTSERHDSRPLHSVQVLSLPQ